MRTSARPGGCRFSCGTWSAGAVWMDYRTVSAMKQASPKGPKRADPRARRARKDRSRCFPARKLSSHRLWLSRPVKKMAFPDGMNGGRLRGCVGVWVCGADDQIDEGVNDSTVVVAAGRDTRRPWGVQCQQSVCQAVVVIRFRGAAGQDGPGRCSHM